MGERDLAIELSDVRDFIKDVKGAFYDKVEELTDVLRYSMIKGIVTLRIEETKLIKEKKNRLNKLSNKTGIVNI